MLSLHNLYVQILNLDFEEKYTENIRASKNDMMIYTILNKLTDIFWIKHVDDLF